MMMEWEFQEILILCTHQAKRLQSNPFKHHSIHRQLHPVHEKLPDLVFIYAEPVPELEITSDQAGTNLKMKIHLIDLI
ncbi:hypothetical protein O5D80_002245 [Batrachochytrium dendrobatidis]|nr:hypothetical protein O5D80_002245 [Batrachochytrium dendrobatidis]